jgi:predicted nucleic-acid-binding protein
MIEDNELIIDDKNIIYLNINTYEKRVVYKYQKIICDKI